METNEDIIALVIGDVNSRKHDRVLVKGVFATIIKNLATGKSQEPDEDFNKFAAIMGASSFILAVLISVPESLAPLSSTESIYSSDEESALRNQPPPPTATLAALAKSSASRGENEGTLTVEHFLDACVLFYMIRSIPLGKDKPGYTLRITGWVISLLNSTVNIVIHFITALATSVSKIVRAVLDAIFQAVIFALSVAASVLELNTASFPGKDDPSSKLDIANNVFLLLGSWSSSLERILEESPYKILATVSKYGSYVLAGVMIVTKVGIHIAHHNYTDIPFMGDV